VHPSGMRQEHVGLSRRPRRPFEQLLVMILIQPRLRVAGPQELAPCVVEAVCDGRCWTQIGSADRSSMWRA
jgi:hypothetical protein